MQNQNKSKKEKEKPEHQAGSSTPTHVQPELVWASPLMDDMCAGLRDCLYLGFGLLRMVVQKAVLRSF